MSHLVKFRFVVLLLLAGFLVGCGANVPRPQVSPPEISSNVTSEKSVPVQETHPVVAGSMHLKVYYATKDARYITPEVITVGQNLHPAQTAMELLVAGPQNTEHEAVMPAEAKVKSIAVKDHIAYVDFNDRIIKNNTGGSAAEILLVGAIVNTLTEFPEIHKVQILVEGNKVDTLSGHLDVSEPLSRSESIIKK